MTKKILIIDDEKDFTELMGTLLKYHDLEVDTLNDTQDFDDMLSKKNYSLIMTDLMMPHIDGFHLIDKSRHFTGYENTPIMAITAKMLNDQERKFLLQNEVHVLFKPFEPREVVTQIRQLLG